MQIKFKIVKSFYEKELFKKAFQIKSSLLLDEKAKKTGQTSLEIRKRSKYSKRNYCCSFNVFFQFFESIVFIIPTLSQN